VEATWSGIVLVGGDDEEADRLLAERRAKGMDPPSWSGSVDRFGAFLAELANAGAGWAILVPAGPPGRRELLAERVLPAR
jgi:alkanesulfonate monooxygenase SsuD/methylene tetrahydromethanopterin reductase-like flavin-dependent oxidoreductase (luciferase family)